MCVTGYKTYQKSEKILGITRIKKVLFYELIDGHTEGITYYDITAYGGIGAIVVME